MEKLNHASVTQFMNDWKVYQISALFHDKENNPSKTSVYEYLLEPKTLEQIVDYFGFNFDSTRRFLNCWTYLGIIKKQGNEYLSVNPQPVIGSSEALEFMKYDMEQLDLDNSVHVRIVYFQKAVYPFTTVQALWGALKNGQSQWMASKGMQVNEVFELYKGTDRLPELFARSFANTNEEPDNKMIAALPWQKGFTVLEVGGGTGQLSRRIFAHFPDVERIVNYDAEAGLKTLKPLYDLWNPNPEKLKMVFGDFFVKTETGSLYNLSVEDKFDYVFLCWVLHDWNDEICIEILTRAGKHLKENGKLVIAELFLDKDGLGRASVPDVLMLTMANGLERRVEDYKKLIQSAGFEVDLVVESKETRGFLTAVKKSGKK